MPCCFVKVPLRMDSRTYGQFRIDYSVIDLEKRFDLEDEWRAAGREPKGKAFFTALRERLEGSE